VFIHFLSLHISIAEVEIVADRENESPSLNDFAVDDFCFQLFGVAITM